jgi:hypothetical protein
MSWFAAASSPSASAVPQERKVALPSVLGVKKMGKLSGSKKSRQPPMINLTPTLRHIFRFSTAVGVASTITVGNILGALGGVGTVTNSTITGFCSSFRIRRLRAWQVSSTNTSATSILSVDWAGTSNQRDDLVLSAQVGVSESVSFDSVPPKGTLADFWWTTAAASTTLFLLTATADAFVDLDVEYTTVGAINTGGISYTGFTTVVLGSIYYGYLDGKTGSGWKPVGLPSTT